MTRHLKLITIIAAGVLPLMGCTTPGGTPTAPATSGTPRSTPTAATTNGTSGLTNTVVINAGSPVVSVAIGQLNGKDVLVSGRGDGTVQVWDAGGQPIGEPLSGAHSGPGDNWPWPYAAIGRLDGQDVIATTGHGIQIWDADRHLVGPPIEVGAGPVALGRLNGKDVIVADGPGIHSAGVWDTEGKLLWQTTSPTDCALIADAYAGIDSVTMGRLNGQDVIVVTYYCSPDRVVQIWDAQGKPVGKPMVGGRQVAIGQLNGQDVIVASSGDSEVRIWDASGQPVLQPLAVPPYNGSPDAVFSVATGRFNDQDVIAAGTYYGGLIKIWDGAGNVFAQASADQGECIYSLTIGQLNGQDVLVSGSDEGFVRIWQITG